MDLEKKIRELTISFIQDLYARECMRVKLYEELPNMDEATQRLRAEKSKHRDFLLALLRKRNAKPSKVTPFFILAGKILGKISALFPQKWIIFIENTLEWWLYLRYKKYFYELKKHSDVRSMIEAIQNKRFIIEEPGEDVLDQVNEFLQAQIRILQQRQVIPSNEVS